MNRLKNITRQRNIRQKRVRAKIIGTPVRPRLSVTISNLHVTAQIIDDSAGKTLVAATSVGKKAKSTLTEKAAEVGKDIGLKAKKIKLSQVVLDRRSRRYHNRLKAFSDAVRQEGIQV